MLHESRYDIHKTNFLVQGFKHGFNLQYTGNREISRKAPNLRFMVGDKLDLWTKVMNEVKLGRCAGPFAKPPFEFFIQSPVGLVPKDNGTKTRLIFHLSYPKGQNISVNSNTPEHLCKVKYPDFDDAIRRCLEEGEFCYMAKSDLISAFRILPVRPQDWCLLVMKAQSPIDGLWYYFVDKCLPFGHALSCALFQRVSDAISHLTKYKTKKENINYLDDFFFVDVTKWFCNQQVHHFIEICTQIAFPVALDKTYWATTSLTFLGLLINALGRYVSIPVDKIEKIGQIILNLLNRDSRKVELRELQIVCGHLNFICRCVIPGRAFTRRLYMATSGLLKPHHHTRLTVSLRNDLFMWLKFLSNPNIFCRPFLDFTKLITANEISLYTDASRNANLGAGGICERSWFLVRWDYHFIIDNQPSIEFLELFAVVVAVKLWIKRYQNSRILLFCDNMSVVYMINKNTSNCEKCLKLIRILVLEAMLQNVRVFAKHVSTKDNKFADLLSRMRVPTFFRLGKGRFNPNPEKIPEDLWPLEKIWFQKD